MLVGKQKEQHIHSRNSIIRKTSVFFRNHFRNSLRIIPALAFSFCTMLPVVLPSQNTWQKETLLLMNKAAAKTLEPSRILWLKNPETAGAVAAFSTENKIVNKNSEIIPVDMHVRKISLPSTGNTTLDFLISCTAVVVGIMVGGAVLALIVPFLLSLLVMTDDIHIFPKRKITSYGPSYLVFMAKAPVGFNTWDGKLTGTAKGELLFCLQVKSFNAWDGKIEKTVKNYARNTQKTYKINLTSQEKLALIAKPFFAIVKDANGTKYMIIREYHDSLNVYACKENKTIDLDIYYLIDKSVRAGIFALKDGESYEIRPSKISREIRELISRGSYGTCICFVKKDGNQLFILGYVIPAPSSGGNIPSFSEPCFLAGTPISTPRGAIPIEKIAKGMAVFAFSNDRIVKSKVSKMHIAECTGYYVVSTKNASVKVTAEHPFYIGKGEFIKASKLRKGRHVFIESGKKFLPAKITSVKHVKKGATVYNLTTGNPHTYFAAGFAVHNKSI